MIKQAMILAAGYGKRMEEMTSNIPKPMVEINGISLIERLILDIVKSGIQKILINSHYLADKLKMHINSLIDKYSLKDKINLFVSYEPELLETGGAVKKNLDFFESKPFFVLNSDTIYSNLNENLENLVSQLKKYNEAEIILSVTEEKNINGLCNEKSDFILENDKLYISPENNLIYTGLQLMNNVKFDQIKEEKFSNAILYQKLSKKNMLYGIKFVGNLFHVGDIKGFLEAKKYYELTKNIYF